MGPINRLCRVWSPQLLLLFLDIILFFKCAVYCYLINKYFTYCQVVFWRSQIYYTRKKSRRHKHIIKVTLNCYPGFRRAAPQGDRQHDPRAVLLSAVHHDHVPAGVAGTRAQVLRSQVPEQGVARRVCHPGGGQGLRRGQRHARLGLYQPLSDTHSRFYLYLF